MEIFDNGYLTEEEKNAIDLQDLIYLAVSNYTGKPHDKILPLFIYKYKLKDDGHILRVGYRCPKISTSNDVLWETFINARQPESRYHILYEDYIPFEYMDDDGNIHKIDENNAESETIFLDFVSRKTPYKHLRSLEPDTAYFLAWVSDADFLDTLEKFA